MTNNKASFTNISLFLSFSIWIVTFVLFETENVIYFEVIRDFLKKILSQLTRNIFLCSCAPVRTCSPTHNTNLSTRSRSTTELSCSGARVSNSYRNTMVYRILAGWYSRARDSKGTHYRDDGSFTNKTTITDEKGFWISPKYFTLTSVNSTFIGSPTMVPSGCLYPA